MLSELILWFSSILTPHTPFFKLISTASPLITPFYPLTNSFPSSRFPSSSSTLCILHAPLVFSWPPSLPFCKTSPLHWPKHQNSLILLLGCWRDGPSHTHWYQVMISSLSWAQCSLLTFWDVPIPNYFRKKKTTPFYLSIFSFLLPCWLIISRVLLLSQIHPSFLRPSCPTPQDASPSITMNPCTFNLFCQHQNHSIAVISKRMCLPHVHSSCQSLFFLPESSYLK